MNKNLIVIDVENNDFGYTYIVRDFFKSYKLNSQELFKLFDFIHVEAKVIPYENSNNLNLFKEKNFNLSRKIVGLISNYKITHINNFDFLNLSFLKLNINDFDEYTNFSYLLKLNSLTIYSFVAIIKKILYAFDIENRKKDIIIVIINLIFFLVNQEFIILYFLVKHLIDYFNHTQDFTRLEKQSLMMIILLIYNPYLIYNYSFQMIFSINISFTLSNKLSNMKSELMILLILFPFIYKINGYINLIIILIIPLIRILLKKFSIVIIIASLLFPFLSLFKKINEVFLFLDDFLIKYKIVFNFFNLEGVYLLSYLIIILIIFNIKNIKLFYTFVCVILSLFIIINVDIPLRLKDEVIFLDVLQGDSSIIIKNNKVIVVDSFQFVDNYLSNKHIKRIDYLILTHNDLDHIKEAQTLIDNYIVKNVILSGYQDYNLKHPNIINIKKDNLIELSDLGLKFLSPLKDYQNENKNSLVFTIYVDDFKYLFTGDIDEGVELDLVNYYKSSLKSDILKVPHHGSITSSSLVFLNQVRPSYAIVSVALENRYNLPNQEVIDRYESLGVYMHLTSQSGSIIFKDNQIKVFTS